MYTEGLISRLNNPNLNNPENDGYKFLDGTVGEYLEHYDNHVYDLFLARASGGYLDLHGKLYGIFRREDESDEELRRRILNEEFIVQSTTDFLGLDVVLWVYFTDILDKNVLSSRNPYLKNEHDSPYVFMGTGDDTGYLQGKFLVEDILWE